MTETTRPSLRASTVRTPLNLIRSVPVQAERVPLVFRASSPPAWRRRQFEPFCLERREDLLFQLERALFQAAETRAGVTGNEGSAAHQSLINAALR
jgi:hypothetical protein